jgi:glycerophosphoryl diester phosphodiesterase
MSHAGGGEEHLENSWPAFEATVELGYPYLETDTVATSDQVLLAFHDTSLDGLTDAKGEISKMTYEQVKSAKIRGEEPIPRLDEVFERWPDLRINIEPKSDQAVDPLIALIRSTGSIDRVCVGSFNDRRVRKMRAALGPGLCTSIGVTPTVLLRLASWGVPFLDGFVRRSGAGCVQSPVKQWIVPVTDRRFVARCHGLGLQVHVWTIDDPAEIGRLLDLGVDGIMTNKPALMKETLVARGQWTGG